MSAALVLGAMAAVGSVGAAAAMSGSAASVPSIERATALPKIEVRGGIRYEKKQTARYDERELQERGLWEAEADRFGDRERF